MDADSSGSAQELRLVWHCECRTPPALSCTGLALRRRLARLRPRRRDRRGRSRRPRQVLELCIPRPGCTDTVRQYHSASAWSSLATACRHACQCGPLMRANCVFSPRAEGFDGGMSRVVHRLWNDNDTSSERPTPSRHATPRGHHRSSVAIVLLFLFSFVFHGCAVTGPLEGNYDDATQY